MIPKTIAFIADAFFISSPLRDVVNEKSEIKDWQVQIQKLIVLRES